MKLTEGSGAEQVNLYNTACASWRYLGSAQSWQSFTAVSLCCLTTTELSLPWHEVLLMTKSLLQTHSGFLLTSGAGSPNRRLGGSMCVGVAAYQHPQGPGM